MIRRKMLLFRLVQGLAGSEHSTTTVRMKEKAMQYDVLVYASRSRSIGGN